MILRTLLESPLTWFWVLMLLGWVLLWRKSRYGQVILFFSLAWLWVISSTPLPQWLTRRIEAKYIPIQSQEIPDSALILVLGGGHTVSFELPPTDQLSAEALTRLAEALRIHSLGKSSRLVLSGYSASGRLPHANIMALAAISMGLPASDTVLLTNGRNTRQEIEAFVSRFGKETPLVLVTSAIHMRRASKWCEKYGLNVIPAPAGYLMKIDPEVSPYDFVPSYQKIMLTQRIIHEYLGLLLV